MSLRDKFKHDMHKVTRDEWIKAVMSDLDPAKFAGESWYATDEYANPNDIDSAHTRGEIGHEETYYPGPKRKNRHARR